ncbi:GNAT family N-acetyltransferase [Saccharospirillum salsuginis]|uniref:N-acetyltransferase n=1 Tax=Saccharospirillum salsuginis TaxID=418750 RepID=A0A918K2I7_9GAMM|nr:GNAT family N-acetyltransferase [Saccharospirillum salsuginis]GGX43304.1 N-acetyltransferase [Saccharospirillum salsuginis]
MTTVWHLELRSHEKLNAKPWPDLPLQFAEVEVKQGEFNRFLYQLVGQHWNWRDKNSWSMERWREHTERPEHRIWLLMVRGSPAGYVEMERQPGNQVEFISVGLAKPFIGMGLGGPMLSEALKVAFNWTDEDGNPPERVWLHTCSDDHPSALANYQARGFEIFKVEDE